MNNINILMGRKKLEWVAYNYELSNHAKERLKERMDTTKTIKELILNSPLAWKEASNIYSIALNLYEYIVVAIEQIDGKTPTAKVITFVDTQDSEVNVIDKFTSVYNNFKNKLTGGTNNE